MQSWARDLQSVKPLLVSLQAFISTVLVAMLSPTSAGASTTAVDIAPFQVPLSNGIDVWVAPSNRGATVCVRLEADVGLRDERPGSYGMAAAFGADLLAGATVSLPPGGAQKLGMDEALMPRVELDTMSTALTLCGHPAALARSLWLTGERIATATKSDAPTSAGTKAGHRTVAGAIWHGARSSRYDAVGRLGDALDTATARALGPVDGNNGFTSRANASRASGVQFDRLVRRARSFVRFRVIVAGPASALDARTVSALVRTHLGPIPSAKPAQRPKKATVPSVSTTRRSRIRHQRDASHLVVAAWDLRGVDKLTGFSRIKNDAALFALYHFIDRADTLAGALIDSHQLARSLETRLNMDETASLAIAVEARSRDTREVERLALEEIARLASDKLSPAQVRSVTRRFAVDMRLQWALPHTRADLLGDLLASGRVNSNPKRGSGVYADAVAWMAGLEAALKGLTPEALKTFAGFALTDDRRVVVTMLPSRVAEPEMALTEALIDTYRRVVVDVRCRTWGEQSPLSVVMERKYKWTATKYIAVTRAMTRQRPGLMREMISDADGVCGEWQRLSSLVKTRKRAISIHKAVACGPSRLSDDARRDKAMAVLFRRFDLDQSVYRPLIRMLREDVAALNAINAVDTRCKPKFGPAVP